MQTQISKYKFFVSTELTLEREVFPTFDSFEYDFEYFNEYTWDFNVNLSTDFVFTNKPNGVNDSNKIELAYTYFYNLSQALVPNTNIRIMYYNGNTYVNLLYGKLIIIRDGDDIFDVSNGAFIGRIEIESVHNDLTAQLDTKFNIFDIDSGLKKTCTLAAESKTYSNGYLFKDVIKEIIDYLGLNIVLLDDFAPFLKNSGLNIDNLLIFQKSDIKKPNATQRAKKGIITFQDILEYMWTMFQLKYVIYENNTMKFLHISELNTYYKTFDISDKLLDKYNHKYGFDNIPKTETLTYEEANSDEFKDIIVEYGINSSINNEYKISNVCNDLRFIIENQANLVINPDDKDEVSNSGFTFIACDTLYNVINVGGVYNYPLSTDIIFTVCYLNYTYLRSFKLNGIDFSSSTQKKVKKRSVDIIFFSNFTPKSFIKINNITYQVQKVRFSDDLITLDLLY